LNAKPSRTAGTRAFSLTLRITQRDGRQGRERRLLAGEPVGSFFDGCFKVVVVEDREAVAFLVLKAGQACE
jgi:hypothetical protein